MAEPTDRSSSLDNLVEDENGVFALSLTSRAMRRIPIACLIVGALGILFLLLALKGLPGKRGRARSPIRIVSASIPSSQGQTALGQGVKHGLSSLWRALLLG